MVRLKQARRDVDKQMLTKSVRYKDNDREEDMGYGSSTSTAKYYRLKAQVHIADMSERQVQLGRYPAGTMTGTLRHEYTHDADGTPLNNPLTPKNEDEVWYLNEWFRIKDLTPVTDGGEGIICYSFRGERTTDPEEWRTGDLEFPE